ncbi:hypothetical protein EXA18_00655 [Vibrio cincinnatiensis]|uniref:phage baseplate plug family protein n=1 Tax=Vibrio cincinnatiensis TaxID=675 RepID=UPI001EDD7989|nr:hypothetical protein [Vibrio cincinnatiensis]MCG3741993.1 hypothetical protein [Vibrio cincinnatiensis]
MQEILLTSSPDKTYKNVFLDGVSYDIRIRYLQRLTNVATTPIKADEFTLELALSGGNPFLTTSLKTNRDVLRPFKYKPECPKGILVLQDLTAVKSLITGGLYMPERVSYDTIGTRFVLIYTPA